MRCPRPKRLEITDDVYLVEYDVTVEAAMRVMSPTCRADHAGHVSHNVGAEVAEGIGAGHVVADGVPMAPTAASERAALVHMSCGNATQASA